MFTISEVPIPSPAKQSKGDGLDPDPVFAGKDIVKKAREKYSKEGFKKFRYEFVREAERNSDG